MLPDVPTQSAFVMLWGPFPLPRARLLAALALLFGALLAIWFGLQRHTLHCVRTGAGAGECILHEGLGGGPALRLPLASLTLLRVEHTTTHHKGGVSHWGQLVLKSGEREVWLSREPADSAEKNAAALRAFLQAKEAPEVHIFTARMWGMAVVGGGMGGIGLGLLYLVLLWRQRYRLTWDAAEQRLAVQLEWPLGLRRGLPMQLTLRDPVEVEVIWGEVADPLASARAPAPRGGRLAVQLADGKRLPLCAHPRPGYGVHIACADKLRALLGCPPRSAKEAERIASDHELMRPRPLAHWKTFSGRFSVVWIGSCCGSLLGLTASILIAVLFRFQKLSNPADGPWFFGGLLVGGAAGIALAWRVTQYGDER